MNDHFEQQLKQDAKAIQAQAEARLAATDFSLQLEAQLQQQPHRRSHRSWWFATAAGITLALLLWLGNEPTSPVQTPMMLADDTLELPLENYPMAIEESINQPLLKEQQAIIDDLKRLREQFLSI